MRSKVILIALSSALAACATADQPDRGVASVNVPVVTTADYVFDAAAPGGALGQGEADRLGGWFQGLGLGYGDTIYVDGGYAPAARAQVASIAGRFGMLVTAGAPATTGMVQPGSVRVVVARRRFACLLPLVSLMPSGRQGPKLVVAGPLRMSRAPSVVFCSRFCCRRTRQSKRVAPAGEPGCEPPA